MFQLKKLLTNLITQFLVDVKERPLIIILETVGTISSLVAACILCLYTKDANLYFVLGSYTVGNLLWIVAAILRNNSFMILLNCGFLLINLVGIARLLLN